MFFFLTLDDADEYKEEQVEKVDPSSASVGKFKYRPAPLAILFFCLHHAISLSFLALFAAFGAMLFFLRQAKLLRGRLSSSRST